MTELSPINPTDANPMKSFVIEGIEVRSHRVEYVVEGEDASEALDRALEGSTLSERDLKPYGNVIDRQFEATGIRETQDIPEVGTDQETSFNARVAAATELVVAGVELIERVLSVTPLDSRPGTVRIVTETGSFLAAVRLEDFQTDPDIDPCGCHLDSEERHDEAVHEEAQRRRLVRLNATDDFDEQETIIAEGEAEASSVNNSGIEAQKAYLAGD